MSNQQEEQQNGEQDEPTIRLVFGRETTAGGSPKARVIIEEATGNSSLSSVFTLSNSAIGAGVLSLPFAFFKAGVLGTVLLCLLLGPCESLTLYVLAKFSERYDAHTYSKLVRRCLGRKISATLSAILLLYLWGSCIAYLVIIGDTFTSLFQLGSTQLRSCFRPRGGAPTSSGPSDRGLAQLMGVSKDSLLADRRFVTSFFALFVITPMCFPRRLGALAWVSMAAVIGFLYTAIIIVVRGWQVALDREHPFQDVKWLIKWDVDALFAIPIIVFGFNCHPNVVTIFSELERHPSLLMPAIPQSPAEYASSRVAFVPRPRTRKMIGMLTVILSTTALIMVGYLAVGLSGYVAYPLNINSNALKSFSTHDLLMQIARGVIGAVVVGHFPINQHPARLCIEDLEQFFFFPRGVPEWTSPIHSIAFVLSTLSVAVVVSDLGAVLHMVGGTAASFMIFVLPGLMLVNAAIVKGPAGNLPADEESSPVVRPNGQDQNGLHENEQHGILENEPTNTTLDIPLLARSDERGIKRVGIIYSPRKSWWTGMFLVGLGSFVFIITIVTAIV